MIANFYINCNNCKFIYMNLKRCLTKEEIIYYFRKKTNNKEKIKFEFKESIWNFKFHKKSNHILKKNNNTGFAFAASTKTKIVLYTFFQENFFLWWTINGCQVMKKSLSVIDFLKDIYLHSSKLMNIYVQKFF